MWPSWVCFRKLIICQLNWLHSHRHNEGHKNICLNNKWSLHLSASKCTRTNTRTHTNWPWFIRCEKVGLWGIKLFCKRLSDWLQSLWTQLLCFISSPSFIQSLSLSLCHQSRTLQPDQRQTRQTSRFINVSRVSWRVAANQSKQLY